MNHWSVRMANSRPSVSVWCLSPSSRDYHAHKEQSWYNWTQSMTNEWLLFLLWHWLFNFLRLNIDTMKSYSLKCFFILSINLVFQSVAARLLVLWVKISISRRNISNIYNISFYFSFMLICLLSHLKSAVSCWVISLVVHPCCTVHAAAATPQITWWSFLSTTPL